MKRLLFIAPVVIDFNKLTGVSKKVLNQYKIFSKFYNTDLIFYGVDCIYEIKSETGSITAIPLDGNNRRAKIYLILLKIQKSTDYDFIFCRYHLSDLLYIYILSKFKKNGSKVVIEIPTFPYFKELLTEKNGFFRFLMDFTSKYFLQFFVDRIFTYSKDEKIYGISTICSQNGIIFDEIKPLKPKPHSDKEINFISVSKTLLCHGFDRIILGINSYYENGGKVKITYHLIGDGNEIEKYKKLVEKFNLEDSVLFYGFLGSEELDKIYEKADIAINSIGIHRIGLKTESTLKSKEYCAKGIPIVSSYYIDSFSVADNKRFVFKVKSNEVK